MPKAFSEEERGRIRGRLIGAGRRWLSKVGVRFLSIDDVVKDAGISKGSFYSFFPSKEDFILSVLESWEEEHRGALLRDLVEGTGTARDRLERFFLGTLKIMEKEPGLAGLGFRDVELLLERLPPERVAAHQEADHRVLESAVAAWAARDPGAASYAEAIQGLVPAFFVLAMHQGDFPADSYGPTVRLMAEAVAEKLTRVGATPRRDPAASGAGAEGGDHE